MGRAWLKLAHFVKPFNGTVEEAETNIESHSWKLIHLHERYPEAQESWPAVVYCDLCGCLAESEQSRYACGKAPKPVAIRDIGGDFRL